MAVEEKVKARPRARKARVEPAPEPRIDRFKLVSRHEDNGSIVTDVSMFTGAGRWESIGLLIFKDGGQTAFVRALYEGASRLRKDSDPFVDVTHEWAAPDRNRAKGKT